VSFTIDSGTGRNSSPTPFGTAVTCSGATPSNRRVSRRRSAAWVALSVSRPTQTAPLEITVVRGRFDTPVWATRMLDDGVGYIRLYSFAATVTKERIQELYEEVRSKGATRVIVDLRDNPGGSSAAATALLSTLIPANQPLYSFIARDGSTVTAKSIDNLWPGNPQVAFLISKNSGSASEIVPAVAQDYGVARVFGVKTEGCVASVAFVKLADGSALGITSSRVDTAKNGRSLNRVGVMPDEIVERSVDDLARGFDPQILTASAWLTGKPVPGPLVVPPSPATTPSGAALAPPAQPPATAAQPATPATQPAAGATTPSSPTSAPATVITPPAPPANPPVTAQPANPAPPAASSQPASSGSPTAGSAAPPPAVAPVPAGTAIRRGAILFALEEPAPSASLSGR